MISSPSLDAQIRPAAVGSWSSSAQWQTTRPGESTGYATLAEMGMADKSFEAAVLRHPEAFSDEAVRRSRRRLQGG